MRPARILLAAASLFSAGAAMAETVPPIVLNGVNYDFHSVRKIAEGEGVYYAPFGEDPDKSHDEIILNYINAKDAQGTPITAEGMATAMVGNIKAHGANFVFPFATPDAAQGDRLIYHVLSYTIFPQDGDGEIWRAKVWQRGNRVIGLLVKHRVEGGDFTDIEARVKSWLNENLQKQAPLIDAISVPPEPPRG